MELHTCSPNAPLTCATASRNTASDSVSVYEPNPTTLASAVEGCDVFSWTSCMSENMSPTGSSCIIFIASASFAAATIRPAFSRAVARRSLSSRPCMCAVFFRLSMRTVLADDRVG